MKTIPKIEFVQVVRECPYNDTINARREPTRNLLRDYDVMIDGEYRATFQSRSYSRGYSLELHVDGRSSKTDEIESSVEHSDKLVNYFWTSIKESDEHYTGIAVDKKAEFEPTIVRLLEAGRIPTVAAAKQMLKAHQNAWRARQREIMDARIDSIITKHSQRLFKLAKSATSSNGTTGTAELRREVEQIEKEAVAIRTAFARK